MRSLIVDVVSASDESSVLLCRRFCLSREDERSDDLDVDGIGSTCTSVCELSLCSTGPTLDRTVTVASALLLLVDLATSWLVSPCDVPREDVSGVLDDSADGVFLV